MRRLGIFVLIILYLLILSRRGEASSSGRSLEFTDLEHSYSKKWTSLSTKDEQNRQNLIQLLSQSASGRIIVKSATKRAQSFGLDLIDVVKTGGNSLTDTTLVRRFSKSNPERVHYEVQAQVFVNSDLNVKDGVLDLAHELTHFAERGPFNPYASDFALTSFVHSTLEAKGGEVDAFLSECLVMKDLFPSSYRSSKCLEIRDPLSGKLSRELAIQKFYQVGELYRDFIQDARSFKLQREEFPYLSAKKVVFVSSAYSLPYPVAAFYEYRSVIERVCQNDRRRVALMKEKVGRMPASDSDGDESHAAYRLMKKSLDERCSFLTRPEVLQESGRESSLL